MDRISSVLLGGRLSAYSTWLILLAFLTTTLLITKRLVDNAVSGVAGIKGRPERTQALSSIRHMSLNVKS